jgi:16S rRNA (cytidine1402-2'-O)-methyltransferase
MLYVVATPIGNLKDITLRAIETLKSCDFIIAENPSYSRRLLQYIDGLKINPSQLPLAQEEADADLPSFSKEGEGGVKKELVQFAEHNEQQVLKNLTRRLIKETGCLITDAGTPGISDPGFRLVRECVKENILVVPIPGANAGVTALCASGLPTDKFMFLGFLQKTASKTVSALQSACDAEATAIFYESPERIIKTLNYIANAFPSSQVVVARELTKMHEEFLRGSPLDVIHLLNEKTSIKGELTVLISFK